MFIVIFYISHVALFFFFFGHFQERNENFERKEHFPHEIKGRYLLQILTPTNHRKAHVSLF